MSLIGKKAPEFSMLSTKNLETLAEKVSLSDYKGKWLAIFFYPMDFTFVCPTEVTGFSDRVEEFKKLNCEVLGVSVDSVHVHRAWINTPTDQRGLGPINFPLGADITKQVSRDFGVLIEEKGIALRGLFIIDPDGVIKYEVVHDLNIGRNVDEVLRVLAALQSGGLCPINWKPGQATL